MHQQHKHYSLSHLHKKRTPLPVMGSGVHIFNPADFFIIDGNGREIYQRVKIFLYQGQLRYASKFDFSTLRSYKAVLSELCKF